MKTRLITGIIIYLCFIITASSKEILLLTALKPSSDTTCRDTSVCIGGDPFNLNLLCTPHGGVYYGSSAILGDQFNPVAAVVGNNPVKHGYISGIDTIEMCSFTVFVNDTAYPAGLITGKNEVCRGATEEYTAEPIANATSYIWRFSGGPVNDSITSEPSISLTFAASISSGSLTVRGMNTICPKPGISSLPLYIHITELPDAEIREVVDSLEFTDSVCGRERLNYYSDKQFPAYSWSVSGGKIRGDSLSRSVTIDWSTEPGPGSLLLSVEGQGCIGKSSRALTILNTEAPEPSDIWLFGYDLLVCSDSTVDSYQWFYADVPIQGATGRYYYADTTNREFYTVQTCLDQCCNQSLPFRFSSQSAIEEEITPGLLIYPNPSASFIKINTGHDPWPGWDIEIFDPCGIKVRTLSVISKYQPIDITTLPPGAYLIRLTNELGQRIVSKFIKIAGE